MDKNNTWVKTYNHLLEAVQAFLDKAENTLETTSLDDVVETVTHEIEELTEASKEELHLISEYVKRDIHSAQQSYQQTKKDFKEWLPFEVELTESLLWDRIMDAADPTTVELEELKLEGATLHTGEVTRPVQLICTACGAVLDFPKTAKIPACPQCQGKQFIRKPVLNAEDSFNLSLQAEIDTLGNKLKTERDEIKVQMHLAGMEAKTLWDKAETKWNHWQSFRKQLEKVSDTTFDITENEFSDMADDIKATYKQLKKLLP